MKMKEVISIGEQVDIKFNDNEFCVITEGDLQNFANKVADQEKAALKEKIIQNVKYIRNRTFKEDGMPVGENEDFVRACDEFLAILNAETLK